MNLHEISLVSQRLVYDQIASSKVKLHEYPISKEMVKYCQQFQKRYQHYLTEKNAVMVAEVEQEIEVIDEEIKNVWEI